MKAIGILGGMGPESTVYTYMKMVKYCQKEHGAKLDSDFPPMLIYSLPVPDVVEAGADKDAVLKMLRYGLNALKAAGVKFGFIACNSMDMYTPQLRKQLDMLSVVEETVAEARKAGFRKLGIIATETTVNGNIYQKALERAGIGWLLPEDQNAITQAIREILEGRKAEPRERIMKCIKSMAKKGADGAILACTDLPVVISQEDSELRLLDSASIIARAAIKKYYTDKC